MPPSVCARQLSSGRDGACAGRKVSRGRTVCAYPFYRASRSSSREILTLSIVTFRRLLYHGPPDHGPPDHGQSDDTSHAGGATRICAHLKFVHQKSLHAITPPLRHRRSNRRNGRPATATQRRHTDRRSSPRTRHYGSDTPSDTAPHDVARAPEQSIRAPHSYPATHHRSDWGRGAKHHRAPHHFGQHTTTTANTPDRLDARSCVYQVAGVPNGITPVPAGVPRNSQSRIQFRRFRIQFSYFELRLTEWPDFPEIVYEIVAPNLAYNLLCAPQRRACHP